MYFVSLKFLSVIIFYAISIDFWFAAYCWIYDKVPAAVIWVKAAVYPPVIYVNPLLPD